MVRHLLFICKLLMAPTALHSIASRFLTGLWVGLIPLCMTIDACTRELSHMFFRLLLQAFRVQLSDFQTAHISAGRTALPGLTALLSSWPAAVPPQCPREETPQSELPEDPCSADEELTANMDPLGKRQHGACHTVCGLHVQLQKLSGITSSETEPSGAVQELQPERRSAGPLQQTADKGSMLTLDVAGPLQHSLMASLLQEFGHRRWAWPAQEH